MTTVAAEAQSNCSVIAAVAEPGACFARSAASGSFAGPPTATRRRRDGAPPPKTSFSSRELKRPWLRPDPSKILIDYGAPSRPNGDAAVRTSITVLSINRY